MRKIAEVAFELKILFVCIFLIPLVIFFSSSFVSFFSIYFKKDHLIPQYTGKWGDGGPLAAFTYCYRDNRIPDDEPFGPVELYRWQIKIIGWDQPE